MNEGGRMSCRTDVEELPARAEVYGSDICGRIEKWKIRSQNDRNSTIRWRIAIIYCALKLTQVNQKGGGFRNTPSTHFLSHQVHRISQSRHRTGRQTREIQTLKRERERDIYQRPALCRQCVTNSLFLLF